MDFQIISVAEASVETLIKSINRVIINPIIFFMFAVAMVYFLYGVAQYFMASDNEEVRKKSKSHMLWGIVGLFIMVAVFGIMRLILNTVGEDKIKINDAGDYVVDGGNLPTTTKDALDLGVGVSTDNNAPDLTLGMLTTSPFPTYQSNNLCWNKALYAKASTEFSARDLVKSSARKQYLAASGASDTDASKANYPIVFDTKILYDKNGKSYYAWLDVRAPLGTGSMSNCSLPIIAPAPILPDSLMTTQFDLGANVNAPDLPTSTFTTSPFATYKQDATLCWQKAIYVKGTTEYNALNAVKAEARKQYLSATGVSATDASRANYPTVYGTKVLYNKNDKSYYAWLDVRAPIGATPPAKCKLDVLTPAPVLPEGIFTLGTNDLSTTTLNSSITNYTVSPFQTVYTPSTLCWRKEIYATGATEYQALQGVKAKARTAYITENNLVASDVKENLPTTYGVVTALDKVNKLYYAWWDARGPINGGKDEDCVLSEFNRVNQSQEPNPLLGSYISNTVYHRVVDSGVDTTYVGSRSTAINNALIQLAQLKGFKSTSGFSYTILEEKYYPPVPATATTPAYPYYDYWVAIEAKR